MKFRTKWIIKATIIIFLILLLILVYIETISPWDKLQINLKDPLQDIFFGIIILSIIGFIYRYNNYILLDNLWIKQIKTNILFQKKINIIKYSEILETHFERNNRLSSVDVNKDHYISSASWKIITIWKIFHFKKFKKILEENRMIADKYIWNTESYNTLNTFLSNEWWFVNLEKERIFISKYHDWKHSTLNIKYQDIEQIEVVTLEENNTCFYIKLKNQKFKEAFYWLKDWNAFINAIKLKWITAFFVSPDEIISDLKEEDLY